MPPQDHVDAHQDQTGTELNVFHVSEVDNGTPLQELVSAQLETGTGSLVSLVLLVRPGTETHCLALAPPDQTGTDLTA